MSNSNRFAHVKFDARRAAKQAHFKEKFEELESMAEDILLDGRAKNLFMTALESAYMWARKALRDEQMAFDYTVSRYCLPKNPTEDKK